MTGIKQIKPEQFDRIKTRLYDVCGIVLKQGKEGLVQARLNKRLHLLGLKTFDHYLSYIQQDASGQELSAMVDALTTNKTSFFREQAHFDFLHTTLLLRRQNRMRFWSAACSSGEEAYSMAMQVCESLMNFEQAEVRILATDISPTMLDMARAGIYGASQVTGLSKKRLQTFFTPAHNQVQQAYRVGDLVRSPVTFARLNLMENWPMRGPFDAIFCRNVMIYFDKETREHLVNRFYGLLPPGGHLFVGHSESLNGIHHPFVYVQPAVYVK